jgi:hypothetical protein
MAEADGCVSIRSDRRSSNLQGNSRRQRSHHVAKTKNQSVVVCLAAPHERRRNARLHLEWRGAG